jgi:transcriptional regulator with XRE-family HTH domain
VRWEQRELAERSGVSLPTIKRLEARPGLLNAHRPTVLALERALEARGVAFVTTNAVQGVTVRWQDSHAEAPTT